MRILSLNAWGGRLHGPLIDYIADAAPDVLCLQEVTHSPQSELDLLEYRDGEHVLTQHANLFREISGALPGHAATFCPAAQGALWDGDRAVSSQFGLATFVRATLPVIAQVQDFVFKTYAPDEYGEHPRPRNAHGLRVYDHVRRRAVSITQMHGLRDPKGKMDTPERRQQADRLLSLSRRVRCPGDLAVICGDFNVEPESEILDMLRGAGLTELVTLSGSGGTRTSHYRKSSKFADYMLISDPAAVRHFEIVRDPEVSDHCPLLLEI